MLRLAPVLALAAIIPSLAAQDSQPSALGSLLAEVEPEVRKMATVICIESPDRKPQFSRHDSGPLAARATPVPQGAADLYTVVAALEWLNDKNLPAESTVMFSRQKYPGSWMPDCARTIPEMVSEVFRRSSPSDSTLLLRLLGVDHINTAFLTPENGFPHSVLMLGAASHRPIAYRLAEPQRITLYTPSRKPQRIEHRWSGCDYAKEHVSTGSNDRPTNMTSTRELADCMRRVVFHNHIPEGERFAITPTQARWILRGDPERGIIGLDNKAANDFGWGNSGSDVFPNAQYFHKAGHDEDTSVELCYLTDRASDTHAIVALRVESGDPHVIRGIAKKIYLALAGGKLR